MARAQHVSRTTKSSELSEFGSLADRNRRLAREALSELSVEQRRRAHFDVGGPEHRQWSAAAGPNRLGRAFGVREHVGVRLGALSTAALKNVEALWATNLSVDGRAVLDENRRSKKPWHWASALLHDDDPSNVRVAFFGEPVDGKPFSARVEGLGASVTFNVAAGGRVTAGPVCFASRDADEQHSLAPVVTATRRFCEALSGSQLATATTDAAARGQLAPAMVGDARTLEQARRPGLLASSLTGVQRNKLDAALTAFQALFHPELANALEAELTAGDLVISLAGDSDQHALCVLLQGDQFALEVVSTTGRRLTFVRAT